MAEDERISVIIDNDDYNVIANKDTKSIIIECKNTCSIDFPLEYLLRLKKFLDAVEND